MAQFLVGMWFLVSLPRDLRMLFMGDNTLATALLGFGVAGALVSIFLMSEALKKDNIRLAVFAVSGITGLVILSMSVMRDILRDAYLQPYFHPREFAVKTQWSPFLLFLGLFVAGIVLWIVMLTRYGFFARTKAPGR
jgi:cytochrome b561